MRRTAWLFASLLVVFALGVCAATARDIRPSGKPIGRDKQGHAIYQVRANGIDIGYELIGSGQPLVMIMGLGGTIEHWPRPVVAALSKKYQLIMLDNRGMGHTTTNDATFTYKLFADDVIGLMDVLGVKKANVLGYSMGSTITQELLLQYPQRVNKAIIHATSTDGSNVAAALKGRTIPGRRSTYRRGKSVQTTGTISLDAIIVKRRLSVKEPVTRRAQSPYCAASRPIRKPVGLWEAAHQMAQCASLIAPYRLRYAMCGHQTLGATNEISRFIGQENQ